jgi:hypothetical protein
MRHTNVSGSSARPGADYNEKIARGGWGLRRKKDTRDARTKKGEESGSYEKERGSGLAFRSSPVDLLLLVLRRALLEQGSVRGNGLDDRQKPGDCQEEQTKVDT